MFTVKIKKDCNCVSANNNEIKIPLYIGEEYKVYGIEQYQHSGDLQFLIYVENQWCWFFAKNCEGM